MNSRMLTCLVFLQSPGGERNQSEAGREGEAGGWGGGYGVFGGSDSYLRTATSFLNAWNCSGVGSVTFRIFTATSPARDNTPLSHSRPREKRQAADLAARRGKKKRGRRELGAPARRRASLGAHSYRAISLCTRSRRSRSRCGTAGRPRWPRSPSSSWSPACPEAAGWGGINK